MANMSPRGSNRIFCLHRFQTRSKFVHGVFVIKACEVFGRKSRPSPTKNAKTLARKAFTGSKSYTWVNKRTFSFFL